MEAVQKVVVDGINQVHSHVLVPLIGASCAHAVVTLDFEQVECFSLLLSKVLGLGIVAGVCVCVCVSALYIPCSERLYLYYCWYSLIRTHTTTQSQPGSSIVKLPQIFRIRQAKSAKGISAISYVLETIAIFIGLSYSYRMAYAFSTYGDGMDCR